MLIEPVLRAGNLHALAYLAGGDLVELSDVLRPKFEAYAGGIGAVTVVIGGRKGWARAWRRFGYLLVGRTDPKDWITAKKVTPSTHG